MKRILLYSHDTFGLGNIRRMLEVARHLVARSPEVSVLVITGSPMLHAFRIPPRIDYVKLPCLMRDVDGRYAARSLALPLEATVRLRANLIRSALADFAPDLVLVDKKPFGVEDELAGALADLPSRQPRPRLVLLLRDILDSAEATRRIWRKNGYHEAVETFYDRVLVVGCPDVFDLGAEYAFPPFAAAKLAYCGYLGRPPGATPRAAMRRALAVADDEPLLLVTPGGGEDGHALLDSALAALALPRAQPPLRAHLVCGPELDEARRAAVHARARQLPHVSVQDFSDDMMSLMGASDLVLAMGGYNTVCELLTLRRRAVLVPRVRPGVEQQLRAERLAERGLVRLLPADGLTAARLRDGLEAELAALRQGQALPPPPALDGAERVTAELLAALGLALPEAAAPVPRESRPVRTAHATHSPRVQ